jgi:integrase
VGGDLWRLVFAADENGRAKAGDGPVLTHIITFSRQNSTGTTTVHATRLRGLISGFHDLRHSGAVLAAATGDTLAELMSRLGHSTPQAGMRYQHAAQGHDREIAALLSKLAQ